MAINRKTVFAKGEIYHVFNRGVEKRVTFVSSKDFQRAVDVLDYYRFVNPPLRFSHYIRLEKGIRKDVLEKLHKNNLHVEILSYCFMPNHFHFLVRQVSNNGISRFVANFTNSYTKFFNTKYDRVGPLFQGLFKAVHVENDDQFVHLSRYIHLNPVSSFIIKVEDLLKYNWSSYPYYINIVDNSFVNTDMVLGYFKKREDFKKFVMDQSGYSRTLEQIKHLILEEQ